MVSIVSIQYFFLYKIWKVAIVLHFLFKKKIIIIMIIKQLGIGSTTMIFVLIRFGSIFLNLMELIGPMQEVITYVSGKFNFINHLEMEAR